MLAILFVVFPSCILSLPAVALVSPPPRILPTPRPPRFAQGVGAGLLVGAALSTLKESPPPKRAGILRPINALRNKAESFVERRIANDLVNWHLPDNLQEPLRGFTKDRLRDSVSMLCAGKNHPNKLVQRVANGLQQKVINGPSQKVDNKEKWLIHIAINMLCASRNNLPF